MDKSSLIGIFIGIFAILGTQILESGSFTQIIQPSAALIVLGGTIGATLINFSFSSVFAAVKAAKSIFFDEKADIFSTAEQLISLSHLARHNGILALESALESVDNSFLRRGVQLVIDTTNTQLLYEILTTEINLEEEQEFTSVRVFEAMGGFAPTFGIVGAVLGLIQVMSNLENTAQLGSGIATAFIATLYGVGSANLLFLPVAGKLKMKLRENILLKEMVVQGLISIQIGENPAIIEEKVLSFLSYINRRNNIPSLFDKSEEASA